MKIGMAIAVAAVAVGVGIAVGTMIGGDEGGNAAPSSLTAENQRLESEVVRLRETLASGTQEPAAEPAGRPAEGDAAIREPEAEPGAAVVAALPEASARALFSDEYGGAMARIDWKTIGTNLREMNPLIVAIVRSIQADEPPSAASVGRIQQLNGPLLTAALSMEQEQSVPGIGVNGKFTDPAFMVNALVSTLAAADLALDPRQERALVDTARLWMDKDRRRRSGYDDRTWLIQKLYEEAELKDGFFAEALAMLTPEQREVVCPDETRDRLRLALFSSAVLYAPRTRFERYRDLEHVAEIVLLGTADVLELKEEERQTVKPIVSRWLEEIPGELLEWETIDLDLHGMVKTARVTAWAKQEHRLLERVVARLEPDEKKMARARDMGVVLVPLPRGASED